MSSTTMKPGLPQIPGPPERSGAFQQGPRGDDWLPVRYLGTELPHPDAPAVTLNQAKIDEYHPATWYNKLALLKGRYADGWLDTTELDFVDFIMELTWPLRDLLSTYCVQRRGMDLYNTLQDPSPRACLSNGHVCTVVRALIYGPIKFDAELLHSALSSHGVRTNEMVLIEVLLDRPSGEIALLQKVYLKTYGRKLLDDITEQRSISLSSELKELLILALRIQRPVNPDVTTDYDAISKDVQAVTEGCKRKGDKEKHKMMQIFLGSSKRHLAAVIDQFGQQSKSLSSVIKHSRYLSSGLKSALLFILHGTKSKRDGQGIWRDAKLLEKTMPGLITRDSALVYRLVRAHWDPARFLAIREAYQERFGEPLEGRVGTSTSGTYRDTLFLLMAYTTAATQL